ncbi:hypothetical protein BH11PSE3_BH11PSE3_46350 [soil metagenome]
MTRTTYLTTAAAVALVAAWPAALLAQSTKDAGHSHGAAGGPAAPQASPGAMPGMAGQPAMGGMAGHQGATDEPPMMKMMAMMKAMHGDDAPVMAMVDHVEGRIAFLRAELEITDAQAGPWNAFAAALRTNAKALAAAREPMMEKMKMGAAGMGAGQTQAPMMQAQTLAQRLDAQERWQAARLAGTREIKTAFVKLNEVLSAEQKKAADELLPANMGMSMPMMKM